MVHNDGGVGGSSDLPTGASGDPAVVFAREVARLLPDVDVVVAPPPVAADPAAIATLSDAEIDERCRRASILAADVLVAVWALLFDDRTDPESIRVQWLSTPNTDVVDAEASTRTDWMPALETIDPASLVARLQNSGWTVERRAVGTDKVRLVAAGRVDGKPIGLDVGIWCAPDVLTMRTVVEGVVAGDHGRDLAVAPAVELVWPSRS